MKTVFFGSKKENNKRRQEEFLALEPEERLLWFFRAISQRSELLEREGKLQEKNKGNFILRKQDE